jgi:hypothetical protein
MVSRYDSLIREFLLEQDVFIDFIGGAIYRKRGRCDFVKWHRKRGKPYRYVKYKGVCLKAHRVVYQAYHGNLRCDCVIHHIDGNGLNNSITNLKMVKQKTNLRCVRPFRRTKTQYENDYCIF